MALTEYSVWDRSTRIFHWLNLLFVLALICVGSMILLPEIWVFQMMARLP